MIGSIKLFSKLVKLHYKDVWVWSAIVIVGFVLSGYLAAIVWVVYNFSSSSLVWDDFISQLDAYLIQFAALEGAVFAFYRYVSELYDGNQDVQHLLENPGNGGSNDASVVVWMKDLLTVLDSKFDIEEIEDGLYSLTIYNVNSQVVDALVLIDSLAARVEIVADKSDPEAIKLEFRV